MFKKTNKNFKNRTGQAAIILIIAIAIALIFYAVTLNVGGVSQTKTVVTTASNMGASQLASQMASYGEMIFQTQLGGEDKVCGFTGLFAAILALVVVVIIVVSCIGGCFGAPLAGAATTTGTAATAATTTAATAATTATTATTAGSIGALGYASIGLAAAAVVVQATIIQPGIDDMWNEIQTAALSTQDQFVESGIRTGLSKAVSDSVLIPDMTDSDGDGLWGFDLSETPPVANDGVSRFSHYYSKRLKQIILPSTVDIIPFQKALRDFMIVGIESDPGWGLHDPIDCVADPGNVCCGASKPSECNPCCQPLTVIDPSTGAVAIDPSTGLPRAVRDPILCPAGTDYDAICSTNSAYSLKVPSIPSDYPWVYDPFFENFENDLLGPNGLSFRERMGQDDRHQEFAVNEGAPRWRKNPSTNKQVKRIGPVPSVSLSLNERFFLQDAMSYYAPSDDQIGIFPVFYKLADWGVDLNNLTLNDPFDPECYLCDPLDTACNACDPLTHPVEIPQLVLPVDPTTLTFNLTYQVDGTSNNSGTAGDPPLAADQIVLPDGITPFFGVTPRKILAEDSECADDNFTTPTVGIWKRGEDRFCNSVFPYDISCPKFAGSFCDADGNGSNDVACACIDNAVNANKYPDDILDSIRNNILFFFQDLQSFAFADPVAVAGSFSQWYALAAEWIEPLAPPASPLVCSVCDTVDPGGLWVFKDALEEVSLRFTTWMYDVSFVGENCDEVWCVPPPAGVNNSYGILECPGVSPGEAATFDVNTNGVRGDLEDIVACLDYNVNGPSGTGGNDVRFQACANNCNPANCSNLPRSLIPIDQFDPSAYSPVTAGIQSELNIISNCLNNCSDANCQIMPQYQGGTAGCATYFTNLPATFDENLDCLNIAEDYFPAPSPLSNPPTEFDELLSCTGIPYFTQDPKFSDFENPLGNPLTKTKACYNFGANYFPALGNPSLYDFELSDCGAFTWVSGNFWYDRIAAILTANDFSVTDQAAFNLCQTSCSNLNCQAMPYWPDMEQTSTWWDDYQLNLAAITASADNLVISNCVDNCNNLNCQAMPQNMTWGPGVPWYDEIVMLGQAQDRALLIGAVDDWTQMEVCRSGLCTNVDCQTMRKYQSYWYPTNIWFNEVESALLTPLSAGDRTLIQGCMDSCTNQDLPPGTINSICQFMPQIDAATCGVQYFPVDPATFDQTVDCTAGVPNNTNNWNDYITAALSTGNPVCDLSDGDGNPQTTADNGWLLNVQRSALEAQNQVAKFRKRQKYLQGRIVEMKKVVSVLDEAAAKTDAFLRGPAQDLIKFRIDYLNNPPETGLPKTAVYAWQDKPRPGDPLQSGYWHVVRVDARTPGRCNNSCGVGVGGAPAPDPIWPNVKTFKKAWGIKRCYELDNKKGIVKYRVTRFDESKRSSKMKFANGANIWSFRNYHPDIGEKNTSAMVLACDNSITMDPDPPGLPAGLPLEDRGIYKNAFILNKRDDDPACWDAVHQVLQAGVMTETCAEYNFFDSGVVDGFSHKFIDCPDGVF